MKTSYLQDLKDIDPKNGSYLIGFLEKNFPNNPVIDGGATEIRNDLEYPGDSIFYVDDEAWVNTWLTKPFDTCDFLTKNNSHTTIVKIRRFYEKFHTTSSCVLFPWWHIVDDAISLYLLGEKAEIRLPSKQNLAFSCFNRNWTKERQQLIGLLGAYDLLNQGWVTAHAYSYSRPEGVRESDLDHYRLESDYAFERHQSVMQGVSASANVINYLHISSRHMQPINIACETFVSPFFPTEKSFLGFFTKRLPIIIAECGRIKDLREQGFDMFDDIIDHGYDSIEDSHQKIDYAIKHNISLLKNPLDLNDSLSQRLTSNFQHLTNTWLDAKLVELVSLINHSAHTWKR